MENQVEKWTFRPVLARKKQKTGVIWVGKAYEKVENLLGTVAL